MLTSNSDFFSKPSHCKVEVRAEVFWCIKSYPEVKTLHWCFCKVVLLVHFWSQAILWLTGVAVVITAVIHECCSSSPQLCTDSSSGWERLLWAVLWCSSKRVSSIRSFTIPVRHTHCMMAEGGGPESGGAADSDSEPVAAQMPTPSTESQKQTIGSLLKTTLRKGDEW